MNDNERKRVESFLADAPPAVIGIVSDLFEIITTMQRVIDDLDDRLRHLEQR